MKNRQIRELLFDRYAANLATVHPQAKDLFVCPICHASFERVALHADPPVISLAHCVPKSLRGKRLTLACTRCDTDAGHTLDKHLKTRLESEDFFQGRGADSRRIDLTVGDYTVRADHFIRHKDGSLHHDIRIDGENSNPIMVMAMQNGMCDGTLTSVRQHISFENTWFDLRASQISLLRAAFLTMFKFFGYGYVLHPNLRNTKLQILNPAQQIIAGRPVVTILTENVPPNKIGIVTEPRELRSFFVTLQLRTKAKTETQMAVLLPGIDAEGASIYERIARDQDGRDSRTMTMKTLSPSDEDLGESDSCYKAWYFWHEVLQEPG